MNTAVAEFLVVQANLLGLFAGEFLYPRHCLALLFRRLNLLKHLVGNFLVLVQIVIDFALDKVTDELVDAYARQRIRITIFIFLWGHICRAELNFCLAFESRFNDIYSDGSYNSATNVLRLEIFAVVFLDGAGNVLLECALVSTTLRGVLSVYKRIVFLAVLVGVCECNLDVVALEVDMRIKRFRIVAFFHKVEKTVF